MALHPRMVELAGRLGDQGFFSTHTYMGAYGAETAKATRLWSCRPCVAALSRSLPANFVKKATLANIDQSKKKRGLPCVTGNKNVLKGSQAYPWGYATALVDLYEKEALNPDDIDEEIAPLADYYPQVSDMWQDAWAKEIMDSIKLPMDKLIQVHWYA